MTLGTASLGIARNGRRRWVRLDNPHLWLALLGGAVVSLALVRFGAVPVYLSADAGHYLADADAVFGNGVRPSRHLPLYPLVLGVLRLLGGDLAAVRIGMVVVMLALIGGFYVFVRGRTGRPAAEVVGTAFFILAPVIAEAAGWYGGAMLLGLALALVAMRLVDDALVQPSFRRTVLAGVTCGLVGLSHPLPLVLVAEVGACVAVIVGLRTVVRSRVAGRWDWSWLRPYVSTLVGIAAVAGAVVAPQIGFYLSLESPVGLGFDASRFATLSRWAFREDPALWLVLLGAGLFLIPGGRRLNGETGLRLGLWSLVTSVVALGNLLVAGGQTSYTTRNLYALPITMGCAAAVGVALLDRSRQEVPPKPRAWMRSLLVVAVTALLLRAGYSYFTRLDVAVPYYNSLSAEELEAIRWLRHRDGVVAVTPKGPDQNAGTLYAWMIEGLADIRALGTGEAFLYLLAEARQESLDVERLVAGSLVLEDGPLRVATSEAGPAPLNIAGVVEEDWLPMVTISADALARQHPRELRVGPTSRVLTVISRDRQLRAAITPGPQPTLRLELGPPRPGEALSVDLSLPTHAASALIRSEASHASMVQTVGDRQVTVQISGDPGVSARVEDDARFGSARIHLEGPRSSGMGLSMRVEGLGPRPEPPTIYREGDLVAERNVAYVYTWRRTGLVQVFEDRRCFRKAFENREVVLFAVQGACRRPDRHRPQQT